jgi:hypothetical protein
MKRREKFESFNLPSGLSVENEPEMESTGY